MLNSGQRFGSYEILDLIGVGGMGAVYRARHVVLGRIDALKVLAENLTSNVTFQQRFLYEAKVQAKLHHPNIVEVHDCFKEGNHYCISMGYVPGHPLSRVFASGVLGEERLRSVFDQILDAMAFSHRLFVVHRDLKSSNILIAGKDTVKIVDFGIAKMLDEQADLTQASDRVGTARYMAPEQVLGEPITASTDVYSIGVLLYEAVTGRGPFEGVSDYVIKHAHVNSHPVGPRSVAPYISEELNDLILKCLAKHRGDRFANAEEVRDQLREMEVLYTEEPTQVAQILDDTHDDFQQFFPTQFTKIGLSFSSKFWWSIALILIVFTSLGWIGVSIYWKPAPKTVLVPSSPNEIPEEKPIQVGNVNSPPLFDEADMLGSISTNFAPLIDPPSIPVTETNTFPSETTATPSTGPEPVTSVNLIEGPSLQDVLVNIENISHDLVSMYMLRVETEADGKDDFPLDWKITYYAPQSTTKRKSLMYKNGEIKNTSVSVSPPLANNEKLAFSFDKLQLPSSQIIHKARTFAAENQIDISKIWVVLEKNHANSLAPVWTCTLIDQMGKKKAILTLSSQTAEILSVKR